MQTGMMSNLAIPSKAFKQLQVTPSSSPWVFQAKTQDLMAGHALSLRSVALSWGVSGFLVLAASSELAVVEL